MKNKKKIPRSIQLHYTYILFSFIILFNFFIFNVSISLFQSLLFQSSSSSIASAPFAPEKNNKIIYVFKH